MKDLAETSPLLLHKGQDTPEFFPANLHTFELPGNGRAREHLAHNTRGPPDCVDALVIPVNGNRPFGVITGKVGPSEGLEQHCPLVVIFGGVGRKLDRPRHRPHCPCGITCIAQSPGKPVPRIGCIANVDRLLEEHDRLFQVPLPCERSPHAVIIFFPQFICVFGVCHRQPFSKNMLPRFAPQRHI